MNLLYVFLGGGLGSVCRYSLTKLVPYAGSGFPWATFAANLLACALLGLGLAFAIGTRPGGGWSSGARLLILTGFCGGFSTFSTFSAETLELVRNGEIGMAAAYVSLSLLLGGAAVWGFLVVGGWVVSGR
ncbi:MAG: CrcB family protein [Saprospiraceae bacterium]